jgi:AcrR family transcriptional regulator
VIGLGGRRKPLGIETAWGGPQVSADYSRTEILRLQTVDIADIDSAVSATGWGQRDPGDPAALRREHQRRRILLAALEVFGAKGSAAATVQDVIAEARVSRATFYKLFADKESCLAALHDELLTWLWDEVAVTVAEAGAWSLRLRAAVERTIELLGDDPRVARICAIEVYAAGSQLRARHDRLVDDLGALLRLGRTERAWGPDLPDLLEPMLARGAISIVGHSIVHRQSPAPVTLGAELSQFMLIPYLGAEEARALIEP